MSELLLKLRLIDKSEAGFEIQFKKNFDISAVQAFKKIF